MSQIYSTFRYVVRASISRKIAIDQKLNSLDDSTILLFLMMIPHLDAEGRMQGDSVVIRGFCCPKRKWTEEQIEIMLNTLQGQKRDDGLGILERYVANNTHCLWMPGFESEQIGLNKEREAKGKYGHSDIPPPPQRLLKMAGEAPVIEDDSFIEELRPKYPELDLDEEWKACQLWWSESKKEMKRPKSAFLRWLKRSIEIKNYKGSNQKPKPSGNREGMTEL